MLSGPGSDCSRLDWMNSDATRTIVQVEIDPPELTKGHPHVDIPCLADANDFLEKLIAHELPCKDSWLKAAQTESGSLGSKMSITLAPAILHPMNSSSGLKARRPQMT